MKTKSKILLIGIVALALMQALSVEAKCEGDGPLNHAPGKYKDLFVLKADRRFMGAKVEVLYGNGEVVTVQTLQKRKVIIDFGDVKHGSYIIRLSKGDRVKEFQFDKK